MNLDTPLDSSHMSLPLEAGRIEERYDPAWKEFILTKAGQHFGKTNEFLPADYKLHFIKFANVLYVILSDVKIGVKISTTITYMCDFCGVDEIEKIIVNMCNFAQESFTQSLENVYNKVDDNSAILSFLSNVLYLLMRPFYGAMSDNWLFNFLSEFVTIVPEQPSSYSIKELVSWAIKAFVIFLDKGYNYFKNGKFSSDIEVEETLSLDEWIAEIHLLSGPAVEICYSTPAYKALQMTRVEYRATLNTLIERGEWFLLQSKYSKKHSLITGYLKTVRGLRDTLHLKERNEATRKPPLGILITGGSCIGKSSIVTDTLTSFHAVVHPEIEYDDNMVYTRQTSSEYWSNFSGQTYVKYDDLGAIRTEVGHGKDVTEIISIMNEVTFIPPQAAVEDKGKYSCKPELVIATSNKVDFNSKNVYTYPTAAMRRFKYVIHMQVKKRFAYGADKEDDEGCDGGIDTDKVCQWMLDHPEEGIPDVHTYTITRTQPTGHPTQVSRKLLYHCETRYEFLKALGEVVKMHQISTKLSSSVDDLVRQPKCPCGMVKSACEKCSPKSETQFYEPRDPWEDFLIIVYFNKFLAMLYAIEAFFKDLQLVWRTYKISIIILAIITGSYPILVCAAKKKQKLIENKKFFYGKLYDHRRKIIALFSTGAALMYIITKISSSDTQVKGWEEWTKVKTDKRKTPWNNSDIVRNEDNSPVRSITRAALDNIVKKHVHKIYIFNSEKDLRSEVTAFKEGSAFKIGSKIWWTSAHAFYKDFKDHSNDYNFWVHIDIPQDFNTMGSRDINLTPKNSYFNLEKDVVFFIDELGPLTKDLSKFLRNQDNYDYPQDGHIITIDGQVDLGLTELGRVRSPKSYTSYFNMVRYGKAETTAGMSGAPWIIFTPPGGWCIYGPHSFLNGKSRACAKHITKKDYDEAANYFTKSYNGVFSESNDIQSLEQFITPPGKYHRTQYEDQPLLCNYFGSFDGGKRDKPRTKFYEQEWKDFVESKLGKSEFVIPDFKPKMENGQWYDAYKHNLQARTDYKYTFPEDLLEKSKENYLERFSDKGTAGKLSLSDAINGQDGVAFIDRIKMSTSAGFPYNKPKSKLMLGDINDRVEFGEVLQQEYDESLELLKNGIAPNFVFKASQKDELRSRKKANIKKYRIFTGSNCVLTVLMRQYFLVLTAHLHTFKFQSEMAVGVNATSEDWKQVYDFLHDNDANFIFGDFKSFDTGMAAQMIRAAFSILIKLNLRFGDFTNEDRLVMETLAECVCCAFVQFDGELYQFFGSNPSGNAITVIINCLVNSLYNRMAFFKIYPRCNFNEAVRLITYGDDNGLSVGSNYEAFNQITISEFLDLYGITYTDPNKNKFSRPYADASSLEFLKRKFVKTTINGKEFILAPLDKSSLLKSLCYGKYSEEMSEDQYKVESITNYLREISQYGELEYNNALELCTILMVDYVPLRFRCELPSWEQILSDDDIYPFVYKTKEHGIKMNNDNKNVRTGEESMEETSTPQMRELSTDSRQVDPVLLNVSNTVVNETGHVADFISANPTTSISLDGKTDVTTSVSTFVDDTLADFFERKVRIYSSSWAAGTYLNVPITTAVYWNNLAVARKLQNFELISYTMHLEVVINATPFHYSKLFLSARPCAKMTGAHDIKNYLDNSLAQFQKISQLYHIKSDVSCNSTMEMELPFIYPNNYQRVDDVFANDRLTNSPWDVNLNSIVPLGFANPTASADVTVAVYAWATDVELTIPTSVSQAKKKKRNKNPRNKYVKKGEEWSDKFTSFADKARQVAGVKVDPKEIEQREGGGFISNTMSTASNIFGLAESVPVLGSYAGIAKGVTQKIGKVASLFGFARPLEDATAVNFKPKPISALYTTAMADGAHKLALDPTQGLDIDPGIIGGSGLDEMALTGLKQKETLITTIIWDPQDAQDDEIFWGNVTPTYANKDTSNNKWAMSTLGFVAFPFAFWSGSIKYRFEVIKSQYHNGRIRVSYEPDGAALSPEMNTAYSKIVDISETDDFEFTVPWSQNTAYKRVSKDLIYQSYIPPAGIKNYNAETCNGIIYVSVLNELTSPDDTTPIYINVYISGGEDFEVAAPSSHGLNKISHLPGIPRAVKEKSKPTEEETERVLFEGEESIVQTKEVTLPGRPAIEVNLFGETLDNETLAKKKKVFIGESYASFRSLLKRYGRVCSYGFVNGGSVHKLESFYAPILPPVTQQALGVLTPQIAPMTLLEYVMHSYGFFRGAIRYKFVATSKGNLNVRRLTADVQQLSEGTQGRQCLGVADYNQGLFTGGPAVTGNLWEGTEATVGSVIPAVEAEFPNYDPHRFNSATYALDKGIQYDSLPCYANNGYGLDCMMEVPAHGGLHFTYIDRYVSTGEDFSLYFYMGPAPKLVVA